MLNHELSSRIRPRALIGAALAALACLVAAAPAAADTAVITFTDTAGREDPVANIGRTLTIAGNVPVEKRLYVKFRAPGGAPCTSSAASDSGDALYHAGDEFDGNGWDGSTFYGGNKYNGNFSLARAGRWSMGSGTFMFCIWLAANSTEVSTPITQQVTFRKPTGSISIVPGAPTVAPDAGLSVAISGASEGAARVFATLKPAGGAPCAPTYGSDPGNTISGSVASGVDVNGAFGLTRTVTRSTAGTYVLCAWLAQSSSDTAPIAGPQSATFQVVAPAPPPPPPPSCIVPALAAGTAMVDVTNALRAGNCALGRRKFVASKRFARGTLVKLETASGTSLANGSPIVAVVSSGAPCVVPRVRGGMRLSAARAKLRASGCTPGAVKRARSRRARGTVVRFSPAAGKRLSPRSAVSIVLSRGRR